MESLVLSLLVFSLLKNGVLSEIRLTESGGGTVRPGEPLRLTCTVSGTSVKDGYAYSWIRQPPNKGLEWIGRGYGTSSWNTNYASAFQSRISISADASKNTCSLQLNSMAAADTAVYYCARQGHSDTERVWQLYKKGKQELFNRHLSGVASSLQGDDIAHPSFLLCLKVALQA